MAEKGCPEYPAYVPYLSWGQKINDYRLTREADISQSAFAVSIDIDLKRLQELEADKAEPSYEEHFKFADRWANADIESWWVRDQGFAPSTPSQDRRALIDLRRDYKRDKARLGRYRILLIEALSIGRATNARDIGHWFKKAYRTMQELNDMDLAPEGMLEMDPEDYLRKTIVDGDALTYKQTRKLSSSWDLVWEKATPNEKRLLKGFNIKMKQIRSKV